MVVAQLLAGCAGESDGWILGSIEETSAHGREDGCPTAR
jgi:hypothetical protein